MFGTRTLTGSVVEREARHSPEARMRRSNPSFYKKLLSKSPTQSQNYDSNCKVSSLFVFQNDDSQQNVNYFLTPVFNSVFNALSHGTLCFALHGSSNIHFLIGWNSSTANQNISIYWFLSYHGEKKERYRAKEHKKLCWKLRSKMSLHFVGGHHSEKQIVWRPGSFYVASCTNLETHCQVETGLSG